MLRLNKHRQDNTRQTGHTSDNKHVHSDTGTDISSTWMSRYRAPKGA